MNLKELATKLGLSPTTVSRALNGYPEVNESTRERVMAAAKRPELAGVQSTFSANVPQVNVQLDREKTKALGVPIIRAPQEDGWAPGYYSILFEDPDGVRLEINFVPGKGVFDTEEKAVNPVYPNSPSRELTPRSSSSDTSPMATR